MKPILLIVDDDKHMRSSISRLLENSRFSIVEASSGEEAMQILDKSLVSILLADNNMPGMSGMLLLRWCREHHPDTVRIMITGHSTVNLMREAINSGEVYRFLVKPWENEDLLEVLEDSFRLNEEAAQRKSEKAELELKDEAFHQIELKLSEAFSALSDSRKSLETSRFEAIQALAKAVDAKDPYTHGHMERVSQIAMEIAESMGLDAEEREEARMAGLIHDVGKIGIPDRILLSDSRNLDHAAWSVIKLHPEMGGAILKPLKLKWDIKGLVEAHHEYYDGTGYPKGLKGAEIPIGARIVTMADAFDAMAGERVYRPALGKDIIVREIERNIGLQFDPMVAESTLDLIKGDRLNRFFKHVHQS